MATLYIDVYFLINLSVDFLAMYFAALAAKIPATTPRTLLSAVLGALYAVLSVFIYEYKLLTFLLSPLTVALMALIVGNRVSLSRKCKLALFFIGLEILIGGCVHYGYELFDKYIFEVISEVGETVENRTLLLLSLLVLISMGVLKLLISALSSTTALKSVKIKIGMFERTLELEALVDSGNLAKDPMDLKPVMLIKGDTAKRVFPEELFLGAEHYTEKLKTRIRMIPISCSDGGRKIYTAVRADEVRVIDGSDVGGVIDVIIAIDNEEGAYGGYFALMPACALENVD